MRNKHLLPQRKDRIAFLYIECAIIEQDNFSIKVIRGNTETLVPIMMVNTLLLGPGTSITHAAITTIADAGCLVVWTGQDGNIFYASGAGCTSFSKNLLLQSKCYFDTKSHMRVVRNMYQLRYKDVNLSRMSLEQMRGMEGHRMKLLYEDMAKKYGVSWIERNYKSGNWEEQDTINQALSIANHLLYAIFQGIVIGLGFSPSIGFIHTGTMLSFIYDITDIYKAKISVPAAFETVGKSDYYDLGKEVRKKCRQKMEDIQLMKSVAKDLKSIFDIPKLDFDVPEDFVLWNVDDFVKGGKNYGIQVNE